MADSAIAITQGSGTNVDTRTESTNAHHRQVIVIGDPSTNAGVAPVDSTNGLATYVSTALPAGTNAIGKLAANDGIDVGDVTVNNDAAAGVYIRPGTGVNLDTSAVTVSTSALPTGAATAAKQADVYTEDAASAGGETGTLVLGVRRDADTSPVTTDGDFHTAVFDNAGALKVNVKTSALPSGAATETTLSALNTKVATAKTADFDTSGGTDTVTMTGIALPANGGAVAGGTSTNPLRTDPTGTTAQPVTDNGTSLTVDGTISAAQSGSWSVNVNNSTGASAVHVQDGGNSLTVDDGSSSLTVDGTVSIGGTASVTVKDGTGDSAMDDANDAIRVSVVAGSASATEYVEDTASAGGESMVLAGAIRQNTLAESTSADGDYSNLKVNNKGALYIKPDGVVSVDDNSGSLTVDGTVNAAQSGSWTVTANAGTGVFDVTPAVPAAADYLPVRISDGSSFEPAIVLAAGTAEIGKVKLTDGTLDATVRDTGTSDSLNVAVVDASGNQITSFGSGTEYTEDDASAANPVGHSMLARRRDTPASETTTDGDVTALNSTAKGELYVKHLDSVTVAQATAANLNVTEASGSAIKTSVELIDDTVATDGAAAPTKGIMLAGTDGTNAQTIKTDTAGELQVDVLSLPNVTVASGSTAITDGASSAIKATVFDLTNSNPIAVQLTDTNGDYVSASGGTQYSEDAAAAANPTGTMGMAVRADTLGAVTSDDGDNIALRATNKGELYVKQTDAVPVTDNSGSLTVDGTVAATQSGTWNVTNISGTVSLPTGAATETTLSALNTKVATAKTADYDTDAGTDTVQMVGMALPGAGGAVAGGTSTNPLRTDPTGTTTQPVSDAGGSLTVDGSVSVSGTASVTIKDSTGDSAMDDTNNAVRVNQVAGSGALEDGISSSIKATVFDYSNSNPLAVRLCDPSGDYIAAGSGTQYTEDDVSAANPVGSMAVAVRADSLAAITDTDGDNVALRATNKGELYVKQTDAVPVTDNSGSITIDDGNDSITVDGSVNAAQTGTWTVQPGNTANTTPWLVDASSAAVPVTDNSGSLTVDGTVSITGSVTTAGNKAEDAASANADVGFPMMAVRNDSATDKTDTNGDYTMLSTDSAGRLGICDLGGAISIDDGAGSITVDGTVAATQSGTWNVTNVSGTVSLPTGASTLAEQQTQTTSLQLIDDIVQVDDAAFTPATSKIAMVGAEFDDSAPDSVNEGDGGALRMSANRNLYSTIRDAAGNERGANVNASNQLSVSVDNTVTVASHNVTNAGTFAVQATCTNAGTFAVQAAGAIAHDAADSGNPVKVGAKAISSLATATLVASADRTDNQSDLDGTLLTRPHAPLGDLKSERVSNTDGAATAFTNFGAVASTKNYVTGFSVFRTDSGTTPIYVDFRDGTGGSVLWSAVIPPNGGANSPDNAGLPLFKTSANTALAYDVSAATTTVYISVSGFQSKV